MWECAFTPTTETALLSACRAVNALYFYLSLPLSSSASFLCVCVVHPQCPLPFIMCVCVRVYVVLNYTFALSHPHRYSDRYIISHVVLALEALHSLGIVHRDIKPEVCSSVYERGRESVCGAEGGRTLHSLGTVHRDIKPEVCASVRARMTEGERKETQRKKEHKRGGEARSLALTLTSSSDLVYLRAKH